MAVFVRWAIVGNAAMTPVVSPSVATSSGAESFRDSLISTSNASGDCSQVTQIVLFLYDPGFVVCNVRERGTEEIDMIHAKLRDHRYCWRLEDIGRIKDPLLSALISLLGSRLFAHPPQNASQTKKSTP